MQGKPPPERQMQRVTTKICLPGTDACRTINTEHLKGKFAKLLTAERGLVHARKGASTCSWALPPGKMFPGPGSAERRRKPRGQKQLRGNSAPHPCRRSCAAPGGCVRGGSVTMLSAPRRSVKREARTRSVGAAASCTACSCDPELTGVQGPRLKLNGAAVAAPGVARGAWVLEGVQQERSAPLAAEAPRLPERLPALPLRAQVHLLGGQGGAYSCGSLESSSLACWFSFSSALCRRQASDPGMDKGAAVRTWRCDPSGCAGGGGEGEGEAEGGDGSRGAGSKGSRDPWAALDCAVGRQFSSSHCLSVWHPRP